MDKAAKRRWAVLLVILLATLAAIGYPVDSETDGGARRTAMRQYSDDVKVTPILLADTALLANATLPESDPFAPRLWQAPPAAPAAPLSVALVTAQPALPPAQAGPPPLPFRFTGRLIDGNDQVVYLSRGDQILVVRNGETLEDTYRVIALDARRMEFLHIPTGEKQTLSLPEAEG